MRETIFELRRRYQRIAPFYDLLDLPFEVARYRRIRPLLFEGLSGRILDAGVGTGRNMPFYPIGSHVVGVDISPAMLQRAQRRIRRSPASVELKEMNVARLQFPDASFDAAVATFLFCTQPSELQVAALTELGRIVKTGGTIRLLDYTQPKRGVRRAVTRFWQPFIQWAFGASYDHLNEQCIEDAGLELANSRFVVADLIRLVELKTLQ